MTVPAQLSLSGIPAQAPGKREKRLPDDSAPHGGPLHAVMRELRQHSGVSIEALESFQLRAQALRSIPPEQQDS